MTAAAAGRSAAADSPHVGIIDAIRGSAIVLIVGYHLIGIGSNVSIFGQRVALGPLLSLVGNAVDVFFFISGFVIFYPYAKHLVDGLPAPSTRTFFLRRAYKIVPSYALSLALPLAFGYVHFRSGAEALAQILTHATFTHGFFPATFGGINGVLWSLADEVEFYAVFPLLWAAARRAFVPTLAALAVMSLAYRLVTGTALGRADYVTYQLPGVFDLIVAGIATAYAYRAALASGFGRRLAPAAWTSLAVASAAAEILLLATADAANGTGAAAFAPYADLNRTLQAVALAAFTFASLFAAPAWRAMLANRFVLFAAAISYNLYLWHKVVGDVLRPHLHLGTVPFAFVAIGASFAVAALLTFRFERPLIAWGKRHAAGAGAAARAGSLR
ncbi:MAG: hypothetical protein NVSMB19_21650 [Vulcanimicrobiaceae bacterium]